MFAEDQENPEDNTLDTALQDLRAENMALKQRIETLEQAIAIGGNGDTETYGMGIETQRENSIPGFQLILLVGAIGLALILLRKRKTKQ